MIKGIYNRRLLNFIGAISCIIALGSGTIAANQSSLTSLNTNPLGMGEPSVIVQQQNSEFTTNLYVVMYISSGITLASLILAYNIFNRSQNSIEQLTQNMLVLTATTSKIANSVQSLSNTVNVRPCIIERIDFWNKMHEMGFKDTSKNSTK